MAITHPSALGTSPTTARRSESLIARMRRHWADYLYVAPAILVMVLVIGYPLVYTVYLSFFDTEARTLEWTYTGISNYDAILTDGSLDFWKTTRNTLYWTIGSTFFAFVLGFGSALVVQRQFIGRGIVRAILLIPYVISHVAAAYVWRWLLHSDYGLVSGTLIEWGVIDRPLVLLDAINNAMPTLILVNVWKEFPFVMIMLLAGLQTVPDQLLRAARVDGAGPWQQFIHVTVPHLKGVILITTLLLFVVNLNSFTLVWLMTGGGPADATQIWITEIYKQAFTSLRYGLASAYSVILFLIMLSLGYFYVRALTGGSKRRPA
jgi:multiple sugar transport system permease protein